MEENFANPFVDILNILPKREYRGAFRTQSEFTIELFGKTVTVFFLI